MSRDMGYHVRVRTGDFTLVCAGANCDREIQGVVMNEDDKELLGESISQIEIDNGWENGLCGECFRESEMVAFYEKQEIKIKERKENIR